MNPMQSPNTGVGRKLSGNETYDSISNQWEKAGRAAIPCRKCKGTMIEINGFKWHCSSCGSEERI